MAGVGVRVDTFIIPQYQQVTPGGQRCRKKGTNLGASKAVAMCGGKSEDALTGFDGFRAEVTPAFIGFHHFITAPSCLGFIQLSRSHEKFLADWFFSFVCLFCFAFRTCRAAPKKHICHVVKGSQRDDSSIDSVFCTWLPFQEDEN